MKYTREYFLEKTPLYYDALFDDLYTGAFVLEERKEYYDLNRLYEEACEKMKSFFSENIGMVNQWIRLQELMFNQSVESNYIHYKAGRTDAIDSFLSLYRWDTDNPDYAVDYVDFMRKMKEKRLKSESDIKRKLEKPSEKYARKQKEVLHAEENFMREAKAYPEAAKYYKNVFMKVQTKLFDVEDVDFYFVGCRTVLIVVMGVIFKQVYLGKEGD